MRVYHFEVNIDKKEFNEFVQNHPYCNLLQSYQWADVKKNWDHMHTGVYDENHQLVATGLVLIKRLPLGFTMFYLPRGPIMDYKNKPLLKYYFSELKRIAKKRHCLFIKFDPEIHIRDYLYGEEMPEMKSDSLEILKNIENIGAVHHGFTTYIAETAQARFHMGVMKCENMDQHVPRSTLRSKNVALRKHVHVELVGQEGLDDFAKIMHMTEERKSVQLRNEDYFKLLMETYPDQTYLFLAKVDPEDRKKELEAIIKENELKIADETTGNKARKKATQEIKQAETELESLQSILQKYQGEQVIAGGLMLGFGKTVEMLYAGMNEDFRTFRPQYLTYMTQFTYAFEHGYEYVTMGGVEGTLKDGLSVYKSNFNPMVNEFIGEFDLPVNKMLFKLSEKAYEMIKKRNFSE
ncbi:MAG: peptidoglycan bridge formation glycyltransferase FemA/FemB family protein [Faecalicoccus sp.]|uniref:peptidoglycan bridge formation glycyltransferase FemA/FemB family protein n=1 Tax=Faecalicoccus sp. TaxID=1971758 RepID=UPI002F92CEEA